MTLTNSSITSQVAGSGVTLGLHTLNAKDALAVQPGHYNGHLLETIPTYVAFMNGANLIEDPTNAIMWEIWNGTGSGYTVLFLGYYWAVNVQWTGAVVGDSMSIRRITAQGTGGATSDGGVNHVFVPLDTNNPAFPSQISFVRGPTGGTESATLWESQHQARENTDLGVLGSMLPRTHPRFLKLPQILAIPEGQGIRGVVTDGNGGNYGNAYKFLIALMA